MRRHPPLPELVKFLRPYDPAIQDLALRLRDFVLKEMGPCHENIYDAYSAVAIGYGWSERFSDGVFHIAVYPNHVNLGFNFGATLDDPARLLEGKGKQIRHIGIRQVGDLKRPALRSYVRNAIAVSREDARRLGGAVPATSRPTHKVISTVRAVYPKKRRPSPKLKA
jgi:Domain of unknown function (DU1801)